MSFTVALTGDQQVPPVKSAGSGSAHPTFDPSRGDLTWEIAVNGLGSAVTAPIKGRATLTEEQAAMLKSGQLYTNAHTKSHPRGEVQGQVIVP